MVKTAEGLPSKDLIHLALLFNGVEIFRQGLLRTKRRRDFLGRERALEKAFAQR